MTQERPLDGVLIADFSRVLAGPYATMLLADLGATVVKVERPGSGDETRSWGPPWTDRESAYFEALNRGKRSIALDLEDPIDLATAHELVRRADVLVENFRPGALTRYALDYESLHERNPQLLYTSISGFGSAEGAHLPGYDFVVQALGGLMSITGEPDGPPTKVGVALVDVLTGKDAALGIMSALRQRESSLDGAGQHIEVSLLGSLLSGLVNQLSGYLATGSSPERMGNQHPSVAPYETLRCADAYLAVAVGNDAQFRRLVDTLGIIGMSEDERFATNAQRVANRTELVESLENVLGARTAADWQARLNQVGVACGQVNDIARAVEHARALGLRPTIQPEGSIPQARTPIDFSAFDHVQDSPLPPPLLGEHTAEIRSWLDTAGETADDGDRHGENGQPHGEAATADPINTRTPSTTRSNV